MAIDVLKQFIPGIKENGIVTDATVTLTGTVSLAGATLTMPTSQASTSPTVTGGLTVTTGNVVLSANGAGVSFTGTGTQGGVITNPYNDTASGLSGTQKDIKILIGTVPYYWTVYPTKS